MQNVLSAATALTLLILAQGCSTETDGPKVLTFSAQDYPAAFDAAVTAAKDHNLRPVVMDRGTGIIETAPYHAGSLMEPWRLDNNGLADGFAHTVNFERRRMRVEVVPVDLSLPMPDADKPILAAAIPGSSRAENRFDLMQNTGAVEMRIWIYVERQFTPNQQIGDWTIAQSRGSSDPLDKPDPDDTTTQIGGEWTPVGRDEAYERTIVAQIQRILKMPAAEPSGAAAPHGPG